MKHAQIIKVYNEIKLHKSKLRKQEQDQFKNAENTIRNDYNNFYQKYPKLVNRILNNNLDKLINKIVKIHKNKNGNYNNFSRNYPELYRSIKNGNTLDILKQVKIIKNNWLFLTNNIQNDVYQQKKEMVELFETKYPDFKESNPRLLSGILNGTLEDSTLEYMFKMYKQFEDDKITEHDASVKFGTHLVDKFVKPNLNS